MDASTQVLVAFIDDEARIGYVNAGARSLLGYEPEDLVGHPCGALFPADSEAASLARLARVGRGRPLHDELPVRCKDGRTARLCFAATPLRGDGDAPEGMVITAFPPAGAAKEPSSKGRDAAAMELIEHLPAVIYVASPGEHGAWRYVSPQIEQLVGYTAEEWMADPGLWARCVYEADRDRVLREEQRDTARGAPVGSEYRMRTRAGGLVWVRDEAVLRYDDDGRPRYEGLLIDISERKRFESELQFLAEHDSLTGLWNRGRFLVELDTEMRTLRRHKQRAAVLMLDLDGLKAVNDSFGHGVGDSVLRATATALTQRLRESDTVARLGGDEFAVLLRRADREEAIGIGSELVDAIAAETLRVTEGRASTRVSIGATEVDPRLDSPEAVLTEADHEMYRAKRSGGGVVKPKPGAITT